MTEREMNLRITREMVRLAVKHLPVPNPAIGLKLVSAMADLDREIQAEVEARVAAVTQ